MDVSLVQSFHLFVELKTFKAHGSERLFVDAYAPSALCSRNWVSGNCHFFIYSETQFIGSQTHPGIPLCMRCKHANSIVSADPCQDRRPKDAVHKSDLDMKAGISIQMCRYRHGRRVL
jgi:hypothetical protein